MLFDAGKIGRRSRHCFVLDVPKQDQARKVTRVPDVHRFGMRAQQAQVAPRIHRALFDAGFAQRGDRPIDREPLGDAVQRDLQRAMLSNGEPGHQLEIAARSRACAAIENAVSCAGYLLRAPQDACQSIRRLELPLQSGRN